MGSPPDQHSHCTAQQGAACPLRLQISHSCYLGTMHCAVLALRGPPGITHWIGPSRHAMTCHHLRQNACQ
eukprot:9196838-Ditylum_brightwellii.AAC.1